MNRLSLTTLSLALLAGPLALQAQEARVGFGLNLGFPAGGFRSTTYAPTPSINASQNEGYDLGLGGQFTLSFPVDTMAAVRFNLNGMTTHGSNTAPGYSKINLEHSILSLGGDFQFFLNGSAQRHRGTFLIAGVSADFERFDRSFGDPNVDYTTTERKSRMGGNFGFGHSFGRGGGIRFTMEGTYHKTLTGNDEARYDPPSTDYFRLSFGWVF